MSKEELFDAYGWICQCSPGCTMKAEDIHHVWPNTKVSRKKFPLYIDSIFNKIPINHGCHILKPLPGKPPERLIQLFEKELTSLQA